VKTGHFSFNSVKTGDGWFATFEAKFFGSYKSSLANPLAKIGLPGFISGRALLPSGICDF